MGGKGIRVTAHMHRLVPSKKQPWGLHTEGKINFNETVQPSLNKLNE